MVIKKIEKPEEKEPKEKFTAAPKYKVMDDGLPEYNDPTESTGEKEKKKSEVKPKSSKKTKAKPSLKKRKNLKKSKE